MRDSSRFSAAASARSADSWAAPLPCTRLRTRPASGIRSAARRSTKYAASRSASRSGAATTRKAVPGAWSSLYVASARVRNPPNIVSIAATNVCTSCRSWPPSSLPRAPVIIDIPTLRNFIPARPPTLAGASRTRISLPSRKEPSRLGASRKSSAEREGGVSTTMRSHSSRARSCPSFSIAMYSCVPAKPAESDW